MGHISWFEGVCATHAHARIIWPLLVPIYEDILIARIELRDFLPLPRRLASVSGILRDLIIDAEVGMLNVTPERHIAYLHKAIP